MAEFYVKGVVPVPEGSHTAHIFGGRAVVHHNNSDKLMKYREAVADAYRKSGANYYHDSPIAIYLTFIFPRPKSVSIKKRKYMTVKPDIDKLCRSTIDALSMGVAFDDDSQIVHLSSAKRYNDYMEDGWFGVRVLIKDIDEVDDERI